MKSKPIILSTDHISKKFGGVAAIDDLSINISEKSITCIIGPNGAGKTTLFNLLTGFHKADQGQFYLRKERITGLPPYKITRLGMARTFQQIRVFPKLSVLDNIMLGCLNIKADNIFYAIFKTKETVDQFYETKNIATQILETIGLAGFGNRLANDLSYGQQKLVEIGRVLASDPRIVLLDEPMAGLSMIMIDRMIELIYRLQNQGKTVVIVEHNIPVVMDISEYIIVLNFGSELASGNPQEIQSNTKVIDAYLGV